MENDLISRKALMDALRGNVLIDVTPNLEEAIAEVPAVCAGTAEECPKTEIEKIQWLKWENLKEFMEIECPMLGNEMVMTYVPEEGPAYYSYTAPFVDDDGDVCCYRYDHDEGCWEDSIICLGEYEEPESEG